MSVTVTYEVYAKERGRWLLEGKFLANERRDAIAEANSLLRRGYVESVQVIRERYNRVTNAVSEYLVYSNAVAETDLEAPGAATRRPSLAELDIWVADEDAAFEDAETPVRSAGPGPEDGDPDGGGRDMNPIESWQPPAWVELRGAAPEVLGPGLLRALLHKLFAVATLSFGIASMTASLYVYAMSRMI
jgi:hypothetical protein